MALQGNSTLFEKILLQNGIQCHKKAKFCKSPLQSKFRHMTFCNALVYEITVSFFKKVKIENIKLVIHRKLLKNLSLYGFKIKGAVF